MDYKSKRWAAARRAALRRDRHQCRECSRYGLAVSASVVHHAWPAEDWPELAWTAWNLVSLCLACHNAMHDRDTGALTARGMALRRRVTPPSQGPSPRSLGGPGGRTVSDGGENGAGGCARGLSRARDAGVIDAPARRTGPKN